MKFSELRLGNWVQEKGGDWGRVVRITADEITIRTFDDNELVDLTPAKCEFIPLDEGTLEDFGFDVEKQGWPELIIPDVQGAEVCIAISRGACVISQTSDQDMSFSDAVDIYNSLDQEELKSTHWFEFVNAPGRVVFENIPYLHQLQNRYYDITRKEIPSIYDSTPSTKPTGNKE